MANPPDGIPSAEPCAPLGAEASTRDGAPEAPEAPAADLAASCLAFLDAVRFVRIRVVAETTGPYGPAGPLANALRSALLTALWQRESDTRLAVLLREHERQPDSDNRAPAPFALRPPHPASAARAGRVVAFDVVSFLADGESLGAWKRAVEAALDGGVGPCRSPLRLLAFDVVGPFRLGEVAAARWEELGGGDVRSLEVRVRTPALVRSNERLLVMDPPGLVLATLRRTLHLARNFGDAPPYLPFVLPGAEARTTLAASGYRDSWERVESRRYQAATGNLLPIEGVRGGWSGRVARAVGLVVLAAEAIQVGKGTTWGQGVVEVAAGRPPRTWPARRRGRATVGATSESDGGRNAAGG